MGIVVNIGFENKMYTAEIGLISDVFSYASGVVRFINITKWCDVHCADRWEYSTNFNKFYFSSEQDRTLFLLRWA